MTTESIPETKPTTTLTRRTLLKNGHAASCDAAVAAAAKAAVARWPKPKEEKQ